MHELAANDIADGFAQMHEQRRYLEILFMVDTCQVREVRVRACCGEGSKSEGVLWWRERESGRDGV